MTPSQIQIFERALVTAFVAFTDSLAESKPVRFNDVSVRGTGTFIERVLFGPHVYGVCDEGESFLVFPICGEADVQEDDRIDVSFSMGDDGWLITHINKLTR